MTPSSNHAPWQLAPISPTSRIASAALAALVVDSLFLWQATPLFLEALALIAVPLVVGIRVVRGFPRSLEAAATTFVAGAAMSGWALWSNQLANPQVKAAVAVAAGLSATGLLPFAFNWVRDRLTDEPVIEVAAPVRVRARGPRRYR